MGVKEIYVIYESKRKVCTKHVRIRVYFCDDVLKSNSYEYKKYDVILSEKIFYDMYNI